MAQSSGTAGTFLAAVQLIAKGCQHAFELADLPGLLSSLKKVVPESESLALWAGAGGNLQWALCSVGSCYAA